MASTSESRPKGGSRNSRMKSSKTVVDDDTLVRGWREWIWLIPIFTIVPYLFTRLHYKLPDLSTPLDGNGRPQPSESLILGHIQALEDIGFRTVGTREAYKGEDYVIDEVRKLESRCKANGVLDCQVWIQTGDGHHNFDIMDHAVLKLYKGIRNVILKISAKQPPSGKSGIEKDAILLGSHIDSTLPSPGAADDGMGVGVMLDIARVLVDRNEAFDSSAIFLWNGGEETLQDGSHLYSTQHESAKSVRAMINLEAAGTTGGALLFQATSKEMIEATAFAPHPRGSVIAADVFSSGIILSDTDFGQFETYLNVSGLDMAIVGHSYFYHTRKDSTKYIERGSSQHFANNVLGILDHLLSPQSPLLKKEDWSPPDVVYLSMYDRLFLKWSMKAADQVYVGMAVAALTFVVGNMEWKRMKPFWVAFAGTPLGMIAGLVVANLIAGILLAIDRGQRWFSHEFLCLVLYIPAGLLGHLSTQYYLAKFIRPTDRKHLEHAHYYTQLIYGAIYMLAMQAARIRSAYVFAIITGLLLIGALGNELEKGRTNGRGFVGWYGSYLIPLVGFVCIGVEAGTTTLDIFVPLTGRMGKDAPAEFIIAVISSMMGFVFLPPLIPLFHGVSRKSQRGVLFLLLAFVVAILGVFVGPWWSPYDFMHPRRMGVEYAYNHTSGETTCHIAFMDRGGSTGPILQQIHDRYSPSSSSTSESAVSNSKNALVPTVLTEYESDWDILYPISAFLETYKFSLDGGISSVEKGFKWPAMSVRTEEGDCDGDVRHLKLRFDFPGLIWPVLAFEAEILEWTFDFAPPPVRKRHHIKIATSIEEPWMELELKIRAREGEKLGIHWSAVDGKQIVPGTASRLGPEMPASKFLIEMDEWVEETWKGSIDALMIGVVQGVLEV